VLGSKPKNWIASVFNLSMIYVFNMYNFPASGKAVPENATAA